MGRLQPSLFLVVNIFYLDSHPALAAQMHCDQHVRKMLIESAQMLSTAHRLLDGYWDTLVTELPEFASPWYNYNKAQKQHMRTRQKTKSVRLLKGEEATMVAHREIKLDGLWRQVPGLFEPIPKRLGKHVNEINDQESSNWRWKQEVVIENKQACLMTHENHPCAIWVRASHMNYDWLFHLYKNLNLEFNHRWGKDHAAWTNWNEFLANRPKLMSLDHPFTDPPQAMPVAFKDPDTVQAYRNFYNGDKSSFAKWTKRAQPSWYNPT